ncbi:MAG: hypothetical protein JWO99_7 [Candidatus Saccharibacteria bacterium]|nr:hypothetical protein [Candidatus Saccharibacteria bacterium]
MQPETPRVPSGPELAPTNVTPGGERVPVLPTPEGGLETGQERFEQAAEVSVAAADAAASGMPTMPPAPPVPLVQVTQSAVTDSPAVAADEDVIEKEWVDKAKKIIQGTKDDPFERTNKVNELQRDYLKKRYNKDLGASE